MLFIKSIIIGICALLPGVSGSVMAVTFGIYDRFIKDLSSRNELKKDYKFIIIVLIGVLLGIYISSNLLLTILKYKSIIYYCLIGIILSEIPSLIKNIKIKTGKSIQVIPFISAFIVSVVLEILGNMNSYFTYSKYKYFLGGIFFSFGKVFPGISSSFFLLCLGIYEDIIILINNPLLIIINIDRYIYFIIGTILGIIIFIKLLNYLLKRYYRLVYSMIIGFVFSSIIIIVPLFTFDLNGIFRLLLLLLFFLIFYFYKKKNNK